VGLVQDRSWPILTLEFKLYALRHPESKERLRKAFEMSRATNSDEGDSTFVKMFGELTHSQKSQIDVSLLALGPILSGLMLESHFESENLSERALRGLLGSIFDALIPPPR
jgi:hypothetical protein